VFVCTFRSGNSCTEIQQTVQKNSQLLERKINTHRCLETSIAVVIETSDTAAVATETGITAAVFMETAS